MAESGEVCESVTQSTSAPVERRGVLLVNTHSRRGKEWFDQARQFLERDGVALEKAVECGHVEQLLSEAKAAVERKTPLVIAGGGDGTFNALANIVVGTETTLGVLPLGTGNAFARDLQVPVDVAQACEIVAKGKSMAVDIGIANDAYFVNVATVGLTTEIARGLQESLKRRFGRLVYVAAILRALEHIKPFRAVLQTENGTTEFETLQVVIGNGRYHAGPFPVAPDASITTGKLSLYALESASKASLLKLALYLPSGRQGALPEVHTEKTEGGLLTTYPPLPVTVDGEVRPRTPLRFAVAPAAIRVMVAPGFEG